MDVDFGLLVLRFALGPMIFAHGYNKAFGAGGLAGTVKWFEGLGLRPARVHAAVAAIVEMGTGVLLLLGLLTPLACAALVGLMTVAALTDHRGKGYFVFKNGSEYVLLVAMASVAVASLGPGQWSLDHLVGLGEMAGPWWGIAAGLLGTGAAAGLLAVSFRPALTTSEGASAAPRAARGRSRAG